jgi:hypothetical protein
MEKGRRLCGRREEDGKGGEFYCLTLDLREAEKMSA